MSELLPEEQMTPSTRRFYLAILRGLVEMGFRPRPPSPSGNLPGFWIIETDGFHIEFGPIVEEETDADD